jgi:hypothetical protein
VALATVARPRPAQSAQAKEASDGHGRDHGQFEAAGAFRASGKDPAVAEHALKDIAAARPRLETQASYHPVADFEEWLTVFERKPGE